MIEVPSILLYPLIQFIRKLFRIYNPELFHEEDPIGAIASIAIAAAGYFGVEVYAQQRAAAGLEAAFQQLRGAGARASHGKVLYDRWTRTAPRSQTSPANRPRNL